MALTKDGVPKEGGWYRCCIYASPQKRRGVHQFALLVTASELHPDHSPTPPPYVLVAGRTEPVSVDMVASWGQHADPMGRPRGDVREQAFADVEKMLDAFNPTLLEAGGEYRGRFITLREMLNATRDGRPVDAPEVPH